MPPRGVVPDPVLPGQESVWDYPRPPRVEPSTKLVVIEAAGTVVAETVRALRVLETSHPPCWYVPVGDVAPGVLEPGRGSSFCEYKGSAVYWDLVVGDARLVAVGWSYPTPAPGFDALVDHVAFYPGRVDRCTVAGEVVRPQDGGFYGGWVTDDVVGPFKGGPGTAGW